MSISEFFGDANFWLGIIYSARLLNSYYCIRIEDHFTNTDVDRSNWFETILLVIISFRKFSGHPSSCTQIQVNRIILL